MPPPRRLRTNLVKRGIWIHPDTIRDAIKIQTTAAPVETKSFWQEIEDFWTSHESLILEIASTIISLAVAIITKNPAIIGLKTVLPQNQQEVLDGLMEKVKKLPIEDIKKFQEIIDNNSN
jgi:flagellar biosynthesis regulator FlaF